MGIALPSTLSTVSMYVAYCITDRESVRLANKRCVKRSRQYKTRYLQLTNQKAFISTADQSESLYFYSWSIRKPLFLQLINQKADVNKQPTNQKAYISRRPIDSMDNYSWPIRMPVYLCTADQSESLYIYSWLIKKPVYLQPTNQKACLSTADQSKSRCQDAADQSESICLQPTNQKAWYIYIWPIRQPLPAQCWRIWPQSVPSLCSGLSSSPASSY